MTFASSPAKSYRRIICLLAAAFLTLAPGAEAADNQPATSRPHDPWVFRCVLDEQPRMLVVALHERLWLAYDGTTGGLDKAMSRPVSFDGAVHTGGHGPQPTSNPPHYHDPAPTQTGWTLTDDKGQPHPIALRSYRVVGDDSVTLLFGVVGGPPPAADIEIAETPSWAGGASTIALHRDIQVTGLPRGWTLTQRLGPLPENVELWLNEDQHITQPDLDLSSRDRFRLTAIYREPTPDRNPDL